MPYLRALRDQLVAEGRTGVHHLLRESGWTSFRIGSADDLREAEWLLRLSYLYHVAALQRLPDPPAPVASVDVPTELAALAPSENVRAAFERRPATG